MRKKAWFRTHFGPLLAVVSQSGSRPSVWIPALFPFRRVRGEGIGRRETPGPCSHRNVCAASGMAWECRQGALVGEAAPLSLWAKQMNGGPRNPPRPRAERLGWAGCGLQRKWCADTGRRSRSLVAHTPPPLHARSLDFFLPLAAWLSSSSTRQLSTVCSPESHPHPHPRPAGLGLAAQQANARRAAIR